MTSSETSTERGLAPTGVGPSVPPGRAWDRARVIGVVTILLWTLPFLAWIVFGLYGGAPTAAALCLCLGWCALVFTGVMFTRAALALREVDDPQATLTAERRGELQREKKSLLKAIKEIEFDHQMGKLDDADAHAITATYRGRALAIMKELDAGKVAYAATIEKELAKRLLKAGVSAAPVAKALPASEPAPVAASSPAAPEPASVAASASAPATTTAPEPAPATTAAPATARAVPTLLCSACQTTNDVDAVFCKKCGARFER